MVFLFLKQGKGTVFPILKNGKSSVFLLIKKEICGYKTRAETLRGSVTKDNFKRQRFEIRN